MRLSKIETNPSSVGRRMTQLRFVWFGLVVESRPRKEGVVRNGGKQAGGSSNGPASQQTTQHRTYLAAMAGRRGDLDLSCV
jgi:hypothetical protein